MDVREGLLAILLLAGPTTAWLIYRYWRGPKYEGPRWAKPLTSLDKRPIDASGRGSSRTRPVELAGDYVVTWSVTADGAVGCHVGAFLESVDGRGGTPLAIEVVAPGETATAETPVYGLPRGRYFVDLVTNGVWTITVERQ